MPSTAQRVVNFSGAAQRVAAAAVKSGFDSRAVFVSEDVKAARLLVCAGCPRMIRFAKKPEFMRCSHPACGCWLNGKFFAKAALATEQCPEKKWSEA